VNSFIWYIDPE